MKARPKAEEEVAPNLIPMIDIMFLLLLFFMLGADMGQRELEELRLPPSPSAVEPNDEPALTVNVYHDGRCGPYDAGDLCGDDAHWRIGIRGQDLTGDALRARLKEEADLDRERVVREDGSVFYPSRRKVVVRADQAALYGAVRQVLAACSDASVLIYKVEVAAARPAGE